MENTKVSLVTGGSGFIGSFIARHLISIGHQVIIFDVNPPDSFYNTSENLRYFQGDVYYPEMLESAYQKYKPRYIFDCAGVLGTHELISQTTKAIGVNITGAVNVLNLCKKYNISLFHPTKPMFSHDWENSYTITKHTAEKFCLMYKEIYDMDITVLRWMNATGPGQHLFPVRKAIPYFIICALLDKPIQIYGTGRQTVDIIDVRDVAKIAVELTLESSSLSSKFLNPVIEVGSGKAICVYDVAKMILNIIKNDFNHKTTSEIEFLPMRMGEKLDTKIVADCDDLSKVYKILRGDDFDIEKTLLPIRETLLDSIQYYMSLPKSDLISALKFFSREGKYDTSSR